ncbi:MAG: hypothetical protein IJ525_01890 [Alphaproteobacteria bacterium]|nr:hypothetical protein [Alphaproteobacteria bacterium]
MKNFEIKNESGRSMIEMLGVLAIIGVLSVGGIAGYSKAMTKYRINKTIEQITLIAGNVRSFFAPQGDYSGVKCSCTYSSGICESYYEADGCPIIKKAKILPDEVITVNSAGKMTSITNPFGENYYLNAASKDNPWGGDDSKAFAVGIYVPSTEACIELLTHDWRNANVSAVKIFQSYEYGSVVPVSVDDAVTACNYSGSINLYFYFDVNINSESWKGYLQSCAIGPGNCV